MLSCPEDKPVIWPSMNRDPTYVPVMMATLWRHHHRPLSFCLYPSSSCFPFFLGFCVLKNRMVLRSYCPTSYMIMVYKGCPRKFTVVLKLSRGQEHENFNRMTLKRVLHWNCPTSYMMGHHLILYVQSNTTTLLIKKKKKTQCITRLCY